jgi:Txe/YoeB family toxin of Txe-Axe toxin-antitoxin module
LFDYHYDSQLDLNPLFHQLIPYYNIITMDLDKIIDSTFNLINRVRHDPIEFLQKYAPLDNQYQGKIFKDKIKTR